MKPANPLALAVAVLLGATAMLAAPPARAWPDTPLVRIEAMALLSGFNAELLSHASATLTLERWCADHRLAAEPRLRAELDRSIDKPVTDEQRRRLGVGPAEPVMFRHVRLSCGSHVLSEADNWYVPARLTPDMNRLLSQTDTPFGRVVMALDFHRSLISAEQLWRPLQPGWDMQPRLPAAAAVGTDLAIPDHVLLHRALLLTRDNVPFSEVAETYTGALFDFTPPGPPG